MAWLSRNRADHLGTLPQIKDYWAFYSSGEEIIPHGPNPYVLRYYISGDSRQDIDQLTEFIFENADVTDASGQSVIYSNQMTVYPDLKH